MSLRSILLSVAIATSSVAPPFIANAAGKGKPSTPTAPVVGVVYPANSAEGCTGGKKCVVQSWGVDLNQNTGYQWSPVAGAGNIAELYVTTASASGTRSMSLWANDTLVTVLTINKKDAKRPKGNEFGPFHVMLLPGNNNTVELRDTESSSELDAIAIRVVLLEQTDTDGDGVEDNLDLCPQTPAGTEVDANGCELILDEDNDGVRDDVDQCPLTPAGMTVDENGCEVIFGDTDADGFTDNIDLCIDTVGPFFTRGCPADFYDQDNDGVLNIVDRCPITPPGIEINSEGCGAAELTSDTDNDGVVDYLDACPNTQEIVDAAGCSAAQLNDDDNDGIRNAYDLCPNQIGFAKRNGCPLQLGTGDADMDGIADSVDLCPVTPEEWRNFFLVDASGCVFSDPNGPFEDLDLDGVANFTDSCPDTQDRSFVDYFGCSYAQFDTDFDGIANYSDYCVNSVRFEPVDGYGCGDGQIPDMDRDGVADNLDLCPATPYGYAVDDQGCSDDADFDGLSNDRERELGTDFLNSDTDADGLSDGYEVDTYGTNPLLADTDQGGVNDGQEASFGLDPFNPNDDSFLDSDYDGLRDLQEADYGTDPHNSDSDFDGLGDGQEVQEYFTNPLIADTDGGGAFDGSEVSAGLNPLDPLDDGSIDSDRDGLTDLEEIELGTQPYYNDSDFDSLSDGDEVKIYGTDPLQADTDQGGITDGYEVSTGLNPLDASDDLLFDSDQDGLNNQQERELGTDPFNSDSDYDYLGDGDEINLHNTNPLVSDTDGGGFSDGAEVSVGLNPLDPTDDQLFDSDLDGLPDLEEAILGTYSWNPDSDYDGLSDGDEVKVHGTNPLLLDTDSGGISDGEEISLGLNPLEPSDDMAIDSDSDGLTNGEEASLGTSPLNPDSDYDGLTDGDEVKIYSTNPTNSDTDGGGESDGQEISRGNDPLNASDDAPQFPLVFHDGLGFAWDIEQNGSINDGTNDAFDGAFYLYVNSVGFGSDQPTRSANAREIIFTSENIADLTVIRRVYIPEEIGAARFIDSITNTGDTFLNITFARAGNLGSDSATQVLLTGNGDTTFDSRDSFVISDDSDGQPGGDPVITNLIQGSTPDALALRPHIASLNGDGIQSEYRISLRPGETVSLISLALQRESLTQSETDISNMLQPSHPIWQGINPVEALNIVNFFAQVDSDGDGLFDDQEGFFGTDPNNPDTDGDGFADRESVLLAFNPELAGDSDADGVVDFLDRCLHSGDVEVDATGCLVAPTTDEDGDGVLDGQDFCAFTPIGTDVDSTGCERADSDYDGLSDDRELEIGTDPWNSDTDADGLSDGQEIRDFTTNPLLNDTDGGGVRDGDEISRGLNPLDASDDLLFDYDHDGLTDAQEADLGTDPFNSDSDWDGLDDGQEVNEFNTNPLINDTDNGGVSDGNEVGRGLNPLDASDDLLFDTDHDGLSDSEEIMLGTSIFWYDSDFDALSDGDEVKIHHTDPLLMDTDGGGVADGQEIFNNLNPLDPIDDLLFDSDHDGLNDAQELEFGTDRFNGDSDFDGLSDGREVNEYTTNPLLNDTDGGGASDGNEVSRGLNPLDATDDLLLDSDYDSLTDAEELALGTDPFYPDSDFDLLNDGAEIKIHNTDPLLSDTDGGGIGDGDEVLRGLDPLDFTDDILFDWDADGLTDREENDLGTNPFFYDTDFDSASDGDEVKIYKTDPLNYDTDAGGTRDGIEIAQGLNPLDPADDLFMDTDLDGLTDAEELALGTSINNPDSDYDEISDGNEVKVHLTNPLSTDTDGGGSTDGLEIAQGLNPLDPGDDQLVDSDLDGLNDTDENSRGTDPYNPDSDADGLLDGDEVNVHGTDPLLRDTDGGNTGDGHEIAQGTNPLDPGDDVLLLPIVLRDGADFQWDIQPDGSIGDGTNNAFDGGLLLLINNQSVFYERVLQSEDKREIILQTQKYPQLKVERRVRVPRDLAVARFIDSVTNTGSQALTLTIQIRTRLGSGSSTQILGTGNGDMAFDNSDSFLITQDHQNAEYYQQPVVTQVFQGGYPDQVRLKPSESVLDNDFVQMARSVILRPGETIRLVTLGLQRHNLEDSQAAVHEMRQPHHPIWSDISSQDLLKIANLFAEIDSDMDGLLDEQELILGTDPMNVDSDFDGRNDRESILFDADPNLAGDSDFDGITDFRDMCIQAGDIDVGEDGCLIITDTDSDGDGVSDSFDACADTDTGEEVFPNGCPTTALQILSAQTIEVSLSAGAAPFFSINMEQLTYSATEGPLVSLDIFDPYFFNLSGPGASIDVIALNAGQTEYQVPVFLTDSFGNQSPTFFVTVRVNYLE